jgi:uncharacterized SAM-binding protein YcdF (DUF218 family)
VLVRLGAEVQEVSRALTADPLIAAPRAVIHPPRRPFLPEVLRIAGLAVLGLAALAGIATFEIIRQGALDERRPADAIVVLGAAQYNGTPSGVFEARLAHAVQLYRDGLAKVLVVTGGKLPGDLTTEAATARAYAISKGVPAQAILFEDRGRNTLESIQAVGGILRERGLVSAVFVSDRTHMLRVLRMATDEGIAALGSPTADGPSDLDPVRRAQAIAHELAGLAAYFAGIDDAASVNAAQARLRIASALHVGRPRNAAATTFPLGVAE